MLLACIGAVSRLVEQSPPAEKKGIVWRFLLSRLQLIESHPSQGSAIITSLQSLLTKRRTVECVDWSLFAVAVSGHSAAIQHLLRHNEKKISTYGGDSHACQLVQIGSRHFKQCRKFQLHNMKAKQKAE